MRFQVLWTPLLGFFSPFPHGTCSLSVTGTYLALGDGPPGFPQGFSCPAVLRNQTRELRTFRLRGLHPVSPTIPDRSARNEVCRLSGVSVTTPRPVLQHRHYNAYGLSRSHGLGCSPFARRYWGNRVCFLFLRVLRWFTSPGWLRHPMNSDDALKDYP